MATTPRRHLKAVAHPTFDSMTDENKDTPSVTADNAPSNPQRRRLLGGLAVAGAGVALGAAGAATSSHAHAAASAAPSDAAIDALLREHIQTVVVLYAENRSFNNLFTGFPGLEKPLDALTPEEYLQRDRNGDVLQTLPPIWQGLVPHEQVVNHRTYQIGEADITGLPNAPFALHTPDGEPLPHGLVTRDLIHAF
jgi:phospholipase C